MTEDNTSHALQSGASTAFATPKLNATVAPVAANSIPVFIFCEACDM